MPAALLRRYRNSLGQLFRFGLVGGLGVLVNMVALIVARRSLPLVFASSEPTNVFYDLPLTDFNVRWYHVMVFLAFLVANLFNFQLNRWWTFRSTRHSGWFAEYWPFLLVGLGALAIGQLIVTSLLHPGSPIALPTDILDSSSGLRTPLYWANLIMICATVPISFLLNKFWTFRSVRRATELHSVDDVMETVKGG